jgi:hypothetical protein
VTFFSRAVNAEELRVELLSDLRLRIENLHLQRKLFSGGVRDKAKFDARINELEDMLRFWTEIEIVPSTKKA